MHQKFHHGRYSLYFNKDIDEYQVKLFFNGEQLGDTFSSMDYPTAMWHFIRLKLSIKKCKHNFNQLAFEF